MAILVAFLAVGFGETVGQVLLIRELIVSFQGNELSLGVILSCWLLMTALGSWLLGRVADRLPAEPSAFVVTIILYAFILPGQVLLARGVNSITGVGVGEIAGLGTILLACLIVLTPSCLLHGFQFPFACRIVAARQDMASVQVGRVYVIEAIGSMVGGALFAYVLVHYLNHLEIAALTVLFNLAVALTLLSPLISIRFAVRKLVVGALCLAIIVSLQTGSLNRLDLHSSQWQWQGHRVISVENSVYQNIAVTEKGEQLNFFANGVLLFTIPVPDIKTTEELAHLPLLYHPAPRSILVIGGGMGGLLEEITRHPVHSILYIEPDPRMIQTTEEHLPVTPLDDARIDVEHTDGRLFVETTETSFDVVIMNLPSPSTLQMNRFYTSDFFNTVQDILEDDGVFAFGMPSSEAYMGDEMMRLNQGLYTTLTEIFPEVLAIPNDFTLLVASPGAALQRLDADDISRRYQERELETRLITPQYIEYKLSPDRVSRLTAYLDEAGDVNRDGRPISTFHNLALWNAMFHPGLKGTLDLALEAKLWWFLLPMLALLAPALIRFRRREPTIYPIGLALFATGFAGMTFTIVLLFAFQVAHGHLYQKIGILIASFMLGLALGGLMMNRFMVRMTRDMQVLGGIVLAVALYAGLLPWLVLVSGALSGIPGEAPYSALNLIAGFLAGMQFPLATRICLHRSKTVAPIVGLLYAADLWGAVLGALLTSVLLMPILGVLNTCVVAGVLSAVAAGVLGASTRFSR